MKLCVLLPKIAPWLVCTAIAVGPAITLSLVLRMRSALPETTQHHRNLYKRAGYSCSRRMWPMPPSTVRRMVLGDLP